MRRKVNSDISTTPRYVEKPFSSLTVPVVRRKVAPKITSKHHSLCPSTPYVRERSLVCINKSLSDPANSTYRNVEHTCSGQRAIHCCGYTVWQTLTHGQKVKITWTIYRQYIVPGRCKRTTPCVCARRVSLSDVITHWPRFIPPR